MPLSAFVAQLEIKLNDINFSFNNIHTTDNIDTHIDLLTETIITTASKKRNSFHIPKISWWKPELKVKRNLMRAHYKKYQSLYGTDQNLLNFERARANYKKAVNEAKKET